MNPAGFVAKRVGSAVGGSMFNSQTSACDVSKNGQNCCSNGASKKEQARSGLPYCRDVKSGKR